MLGFIPMKDSVTIYKAGKNFDKWGQTMLTKGTTHKCQILFGKDLRTILNNDGSETVWECTIVIHGKPTVAIEDWVEFKDPVGTVCRLKIVGMSYFLDWANNIIATSVRVGSGKGY